MKTTIGLLFIICFIIIGNKQVKYKDVLRHLNLSDSTNVYLIKEIYYRDSIIQNCDEFLPNSKDKDVVTLKKFYFNR